MPRSCAAHYERMEPTPGRSVLIVEDHVDLAENLAEIVSGWGFQVITAPSAEDSLRLIESTSSISVVLTDYRLPGLNGAQLIAELRRRGHQVPVIVMSIYAEEVVVDSGAGSGPLATLGKPLDLRRLLSSLSVAAQPVPATR